MAEDGVVETHPEGPPGFRPGPAAWLGHPLSRKAGDLNATVLPAHRLAGEPGRLAGSPSTEWLRTRTGELSSTRRPDGRDPLAAECAPPEIRTRNLFLLREATLPVGLEGHASG